MPNLFENDRGGISYASQQLIGEKDRRHPTLSTVRMLVDAIVELGDTIQKHWPDGVEMPHAVQSRIHFNRFVIEHVRASHLSEFADVIEPMPT